MINERLFKAVLEGGLSELTKARIDDVVSGTLISDKLYYDIESSNKALVIGIRDAANFLCLSQNLPLHIAAELIDDYLCSQVNEHRYSLRVSAFSNGTLGITFSNIFAVEDYREDYIEDALYKED